MAYHQPLESPSPEAPLGPDLQVLLGLNSTHGIRSQNNSYLDVAPEKQDTVTVLTVVIGIVLSIVILFTLIGNGLVVTAVASFQRLRSVTNFFVVSLAVADLTVAILVMPYSLLFEVFGEWRLGWVFCYFWISCDVTCCTASILHLCIISLDRYLAITQPLTYKSRMSKRRAIAMICGVWICSVAISFVPIYLGWFADHEVVELYVDSPQCGLFVNKIYAVISSATSFYIPLIVMLFAYVKIFRIAQSQAKEIKKLENALQHSGHPLNHKLSNRSKKLNRDSKAIKTLGTLMGLFCVSWLPFFLMYLIVPFCSPVCQVPPMWVALITWLGYANSFFNPCVYAFLNRDFRLAFKKILLCGRHRNRNNRTYNRPFRLCWKAEKVDLDDGLPPVTDHLHQEATLDGDSPLHLQNSPQELPEGLEEFIEKDEMENCQQDSGVCVGMKVLNNHRCSGSTNSTTADHRSVTTLDRAS